MEFWTRRWQINTALKKIEKKKGLGQDQEQHPAVRTGGVGMGGSMAVAAGVSVMCQFTGDT